MITEEDRKEALQCRELFDLKHPDLSRSRLNQWNPTTTMGRIGVQLHLLALDLDQQDATGQPTELLAAAPVEYLRAARECLDSWYRRNGRVSDADL